METLTPSLSDYEYENIDDFSDDVRIQELQSIRAIYPQAKLDFKRMAGTLEIPLKSDSGFVLELLLESKVAATQTVHNLPPIRFSFEISERYPVEEPPKLVLESSVVPRERIDELLSNLLQIWQDYKDQCIFSMIEFLNDYTQHNVSVVVASPFRTSDPALYYGIVEFNSTVIQHEFDSQTFSCEICQTSCKGAICSRFDCGHIFCNNCLFDYFSSIIGNGEINKVHCPNFNCTKEILERKQHYSKLRNWTLAADSNACESTSNIENIMNKLLVPNVSVKLLTQILRFKLSSPEEIELLIKRFLTLFKKSQYEFIGNLLPKRLVSCPKTQCNEVIFRKDLNERLVVCTKCGYAFCYDCQNSWHTRFAPCKRLADVEGGTYWGISTEDLDNYVLYTKDSYDRKTMNARYGLKIIKRALEEYEMDKCFNKMLEEDSTMVACPQCLVTIEKTDGCNKMTCSQCMAHFCFVCGTITDITYNHFSETDSPCYGKLFQGMVPEEVI